MSDPQIDISLPADVVEMLRDCPFVSLVDAWADVINFYGKAGQRELCRVDRFYLLTHVLGRVDAFDPWLYERCREVEANPDGYLDLWAREHYKAESLEAMIATPSGWARFGDLGVGDWVFGPDGKPTRIIAQTPIFEKPDCYEVVFDDGARCRVSSNHLWTVERKTRRRVPGTKNGRIYRESATLSTLELVAHDHRQDNRLAIPVNDPLRMPTALYPIEPYTLGCWLGDGTASTGQITFGDHEIAKHIEAEGYSVGAPIGKRAIVRTIYGLVGLLRGLGLRNNKHIPVMYQRGSVAQRLELLRGLMDTDGHCNTRGTATFTNTNRRLVDGIYELATGLGLKPSLYEYANHHGPVWQVAFQAYAALNPFKLERKAARAKQGKRPNLRRYIVAVEPIASEPMRCIQVDRPDGLYLTGRQMVTTHNSTIITFAGAIQEIIRDPDITICIFSHTKGIAKKFFIQVKEELERNVRLQKIFPDIFWEDTRKAPRWSEEKGLVVRRASNSKEATLEAHGLVDGQPTSAHYRLRIYDDVVTRESVSTPEQIAKTTSAWELSDNLGARQEGGGSGRSWHIGTRYHFADSYNDIMERGVCKVRIYPATDNGLPDGKPVFLSQVAWDEKKKTQGSATIACQMLQNPAAGTEALFKQDHLRFIDIRPNTINIYILCDPASSKKKGSDSTAIAVIAVDAQRNKILIDGYRHKMKLQERWAALSGLRRHWMRQPGVQMVRVGYERYGMRSDIEYFEEKMLMTQDAFEITELAWPNEGPGSKFDRIQRLYPDFANGRFYLIEDPAGETTNQKRMRESGQAYRILKPVKRRDHEGNIYALNKGFLDEYLVYPYSIHDDILDASSRLFDMDYQPPIIIDESILEPEVFEDGI